MTEKAVCAASHLNHVCIAVSDLDEALEFYLDFFGLSGSRVIDLEDQGVRAALLTVGDSQVELIQPTD